jgi:hypothetical protein
MLSLIAGEPRDIAWGGKYLPQTAKVETLQPVSVPYPA